MKKQADTARFITDINESDIHTLIGCEKCCCITSRASTQYH